MKILKVIFLCCFIILLTACSDRLGVKFVIFNTTQINYDVSVKITDNNKKLIERIIIPISTPDKLATQLVKLSEDYPKLNFEIDLSDKNKGKAIYTLSGKWPGNAGLAENASSSNILVELIIEQVNDTSIIKFGGIL